MLVICTCHGKAICQSCLVWLLTLVTVISPVICPPQEALILEDISYHVPPLPDCAACTGMAGVQGREVHRMARMRIMTRIRFPRLGMLSIICSILSFPFLLTSYSLTHSFSTYQNTSPAFGHQNPPRYVHQYSKSDRITSPDRHAGGWSEAGFSLRLLAAARSG